MYVVLNARMPGDLEAVHAGHVDVEGDDDRVVASHGLDAVRSVAGGDHLEARLLQHLLEEVTDVYLVLDHDGHTSVFPSPHGHDRSNQCSAGGCGADGNCQPSSPSSSSAL